MKKRSGSSHLSGPAKSNVACAATTAGSSCRSEAALTASNESLSVRRRPSAGKIYEDLQAAACSEESYSICCQRALHTEEGSCAQLRGVAELKRRRWCRDFLLMCSTHVLFRQDVVRRRRAALGVTGAEMEDCLLGAPAAAIFSQLMLHAFVVCLLSSHLPHTHLHVMFGLRSFALSRRDFSGEQKSSFQPLSFHVGQCRLPAFLIHFPFLGPD